MSNIKISGLTINNANSVQVGDNYYYKSAQDFIAQNKNLTETEVELVKIIFENTQSEEERKKILESLKNIKSEEITDEEKVGYAMSFKSLLKRVSEIPEKVGIGIIVKFLVDSISNIKQVGIEEYLNK